MTLMDATEEKCTSPSLALDIGQCRALALVLELGIARLLFVLIKKI